MGALEAGDAASDAKPHSWAGWLVWPYGWLMAGLFGLNEGHLVYWLACWLIGSGS